MKKHFEYESYKISYSDHGTGIPVMLLHGFGEDSSIWQQQAAVLTKHCRVIIPDLPGSGDSLPAPGQLPNQITNGLAGSIEKMAETIYALINREQINSFILLGHSMGGYISLAFSEKYADTLAGLGLIHSSAFADSRDKVNTRLKGIEFIDKNGGYTFLQTAIPGLFGETFKEKQPSVINTLVEQFHPSKTDPLVLDGTLKAYYHAMIERPDRTAVLKSSKFPVLFIIGTDDKAVPQSDIMQQVAMPTAAYIHILENTGHMGMLENTETVNQHLLTYILDIVKQKNTNC